MSRLGEILDQFCDVVLELTLLTVAVSLGVLPLAVIVLHVLREIWVAAIRRSSIELGTNIPSRLVGQAEGGVRRLVVPAAAGGGGGPGGRLVAGAVRVGQVGLGLGLALTVVSGLAYTADWARVYEAWASRAASSRCESIQPLRMNRCARACPVLR